MPHAWRPATQAGLHASQQSNYGLAGAVGAGAVGVVGVVGGAGAGEPAGAPPGAVAAGAAAAPLPAGASSVICASVSTFESSSVVPG